MIYKRQLNNNTVLVQVYQDVVRHECSVEFCTYNATHLSVVQKSALADMAVRLHGHIHNFLVQACGRGLVSNLFSVFVKFAPQDALRV